MPGSPDLEHGAAPRLDVVERALDERHLLGPPYEPWACSAIPDLRVRA